jgi:PilZ domain
MANVEHDERRSNKRVPFTKEIEVIGWGKYPCMKLSNAGMYLEMSNALPVGSLVDLRFKPNDSDPDPIQVRARVLYVHKGTGVGFGFVDLHPDQSATIQRFVEKK